MNRLEQQQLIALLCLVALNVTLVHCNNDKFVHEYARNVRKVHSFREERAEKLDGYVKFPELGSYRLHLVNATWDAARRKCDVENAHLIVINSEAESKLVQTLVDKEKSLAKEDLIFIGLHDRFVTREFVTLTGEPLGNSGFTRWHKGEPDSEKEHCGCLNRHDGGLCDTSCKTRLPFVCEKRK